MAIDSMHADTPMGVAQVCREWFDEDCPPEEAILIATMSGKWIRPSHGEATSVWIKSRLLERRVLRAWAVPLGVHDGTPPDYEMPKPKDMTPEERKRFMQRLLWGGPPHLGYARSRLAFSPLMIRPVNSVADRVAHFDDNRGCPYCRKWYRNGAALRLHVIDAHLSEI